MVVVLQVRLTGNPPNSDGNGVDEKLGIIMFECGLEGILLKVVKRSQFEKGENRSETKKEEPEVEANHADTVRSRDELEEQTATNSASGAFVCVWHCRCALTCGVYLCASQHGSCYGSFVAYEYGNLCVICGSTCLISWESLEVLHTGF